MSAVPFLYVLYSVLLSESFMLENNGPEKNAELSPQKKYPKADNEIPFKNAVQTNNKMW